MTGKLEDGVELGGSGGHAIAGYDYQIDVSIWLALDLVLSSKLARELVLEPASQEDLEADLAEHEPGRVTSTVAMDDYRLVVQVKLRTGNAWTVSGLKALLRHGSIKRTSASKRLTDPTIRYLLVTNAALNGLTKDLRVRRVGRWPKPHCLPKSIKQALPKDAAGRLAIVGSFEEHSVVLEIKRLLTEAFRVPNSRWSGCLQKLREEARIRISRGGAGLWKRSELERVVRDFEGYLASSPELADYVYPTNWNELRAAMADRHGALIIGQSGTGKTLATKKLYEELRQEIEGLSHVSITLGPQQLRNDKTEPPVLYDIEDPWGRFDFDPASRPWNDQLSTLLAQARADRMIVATSRLDVAKSSKALPDVRPWVIQLEAEHYGADERHLLFRTRIPKLPRELQRTAAQSEEKVLSELATPLEIQKFFDALTTVDRKGLTNSPRFIHEAIGQAHENSIERTVIEQIAQRDDVRAAAVIWGLLKANGKLSLRTLRAIEEKLIEQDQIFIKGVEPLVSFFVAARNLRQTEETVTYYHPRVEAGIERALKEYALLVRRTLRQLVDALISPSGPGENWGTSTAAKIVSAAIRHSEIKTTPSNTAQRAIDAWLSQELEEPDDDLLRKLRLAAAAGSNKSIVSEVARFLLHRPEKKSFPFVARWRPPEHDDEWYAQMHAAPETKPLLSAFIRNALPEDRDDYGSDFATEVERLAPDLTDAFLDAAKSAIQYDNTLASTAIIEGAIKDLTGFGTVVDQAVEALTPTAADEQKHRDIVLSLINKEFSEAYAEHISEDDSGYIARRLLRAYVEKARDTFGWQFLAQHKHVAHLRHHWLREFCDRNTDGQPEEVIGLVSACFDTADEAELWNALKLRWDARCADKLRARVVEGHPSAEVRTAALECLIIHEQRMIAAVLETLALKDQAQLAQLSIDLGQISRKNVGAKIDAAIETLPQTYQEFSRAASALQADTPPTVSSGALSLLTGIHPNGADIRAFRVALDRHFHIDVEDDIRWLLDHGNDRAIAVSAIEAAIRRKMCEEIESALGHRFAHVCSRALEALTAPLPAPVPQRFLDFAKAKGSPVRKALVQILEAKPHIDHLQTLLVLANDRWSTSSMYEQGCEDYPIATAAITAIEKLGSVPDDAAGRLFGIAIESQDPQLRAAIFELLARRQGAGMQKRLFDLSVAPGTLQVRIAASRALLIAHESIASEIVAGITPDLIKSRDSSIACQLTLLLGVRGQLIDVEKSAEALATSDERRVFLVLLVWLVNDRDANVAKRIAAMLPTNHRAVQWALGNPIDEVSDTILDDLGDVHAVAETLPYLKR